MLRLIVAVGMFTFAGSCFAADWTGGGRNSQDAPPGNVVVKSGNKGMATGSLEAKLVEGGALTDPYIWVHLHARHNDRLGSTKYDNVVVSLVDAKNKRPLASTTVRTFEVKGRGTGGPDNNAHWYFVIEPNNDKQKQLFEAAVKKPDAVEFVLEADRNRDLGRDISNTLKDLYKQTGGSLQQKVEEYAADNFDELMKSIGG